MRKKLLGGTAAIAILAVLGGTSVAQDRRGNTLPREAQRMFDWRGFYIGGHFGWGESNSSTTFGADTIKTNPSGILGGVHIGQNWQNNTFVYGWEADISGTGWRASAGGFSDAGRGYNTKHKLLASLRARLGMTFDRTLVYATGGLAYTQATFLGFSPGGTLNGAKLSKFGGVLGLGIEWRQNRNFSWRLEGLSYIFNAQHINPNHDGPGSPPWIYKIKNTNVIRLGGTFHF